MWFYMWFLRSDDVHKLSESFEEGAMLYKKKYEIFNINTKHSSSWGTYPWYFIFRNLIKLNRQKRQTVCLEYALRVMKFWKVPYANAQFPAGWDGIYIPWLPISQSKKNLEARIFFKSSESLNDPELVSIRSIIRLMKPLRWLRYVLQPTKCY